MMKPAVVLIFIALVGVHKVHCGGYLTRGGVVDFGEQLDYMPMAVQAGKKLFLITVGVFQENLLEDGSR